MLCIFNNWEYGLKIYALICKSLILMKLLFPLMSLEWPSIVARLPAGLKYILYGFVILATKTIGYIQLLQGLEC